MGTPARIVERVAEITLGHRHGAVGGQIVDLFKDRNALALLDLLLYNLYDAVYLAGIATLALPLGWLTGNPFVSLIGPTAIFYFMGFFFDTFSASQWEPSCILPPYSDIYLSLPIMIIELCILLVISALLAMTCAVKKHDVF